MESKVERLETRFRTAIADDLDLPSAMALIAELSRSDVPPSAKASLLRSWDSVLGLDLEDLRGGGGMDILTAQEDLLEHRLIGDVREHAQLDLRIVGR